MADLFWRCPGCGEWGTVRLVWGRREGEGAAPTPPVVVGVATVAPLPASPPRRQFAEPEADATTQKIDPAAEP